MVKLVHVQKHLPSSGNAAHRLHNAFLDAGYESSMLSLSSDISGDDKIYSLSKLYQALSFIDGKILKCLTRKAEKRYGLFSFPVLGIDISKSDQIRNADIIYIHWINGGFLNLKSLRKLARLGKPVVFFMHDMWTITGGCHHSFTCDKYKNGCDHCPIFPSRSLIDLSKIEFIKKYKLFSKYENLYFIAPSKWLYSCAQESLLTKGRTISYIPDLVNNKLYKPFSKSIAKRILEIEDDRVVISFGAISVDSPYKGWSYLRDALNILQNKLNNKKVLVLIFGSAKNSEIEKSIPFDTRFLGRLRDDLSSNIVYNAADVFIAPSLAETFGLVIAESLLCGTPVVAFDVGGIPDLIDHKKNGYLAKYKDSGDLAEGIIYCLENRIEGKLDTFFEPDRIIKMHSSLIKRIGLGHKSENISKSLNEE